MQGVKHYLKDGTEYKGATHKMSSGLFTGKEHSKTSAKLVHAKDIRKSAKTAKRPSGRGR